VSGTVGGTLTATWSDVGFTQGTTTANINTITSTVVGGTVQYTSYYDSTNTLFGKGTLIGTQGPFATAVNMVTTGPGPATGTFSLTTVETFVMGANGIAVTDDALQVPPAPVSWACPMASGQVGVAYASNDAANGGSAPYVAAITSGSLPPGITLTASTGAFAGTPTTAGTYTFGGTVTDSVQGTSAISGCTITVIPAPVPLTLACPASSATMGTAYSSAFTATGGKSPYTFSISSGSLPAGLSVNGTTGAVTGTPTAAAAYTFTGKVTDSTTPTAQATTVSCTITSSSSSSNGGSSGGSSGGSTGGGTGGGTPSAVSIACPKVTTGGTENSPYSATVSVTGGVGPYTIRITSGVLPKGLTLSSTTSKSGSATATITGTPTNYGTFLLVLTVTDAGTGKSTSTTSCGSQCSISIAPAKCQISGNHHTEGGDSWGYNWYKGNGNRTVTCTGKDYLGNKVSQTCQTDSQGNYCFTNLNPGTYQVTCEKQIQVNDGWGSHGSATVKNTNCYNAVPDHGSKVNGCDFKYTTDSWGWGWGEGDDR
jgi:hypothetical protein